MGNILYFVFLRRVLFHQISCMSKDKSNKMYKHLKSVYKWNIEFDYCFTISIIFELIVVRFNLINGFQFNSADDSSRRRNETYLASGNLSNLQEIFGEAFIICVLSRIIQC